MASSEEKFKKWIDLQFSLTSVSAKVHSLGHTPAGTLLCAVLFCLLYFDIPFVSPLRSHFDCSLLHSLHFLPFTLLALVVFAWLGPRAATHIQCSCGLVNLFGPLSQSVNMRLTLPQKREIVACADLFPDCEHALKETLWPLVSELVKFHCM